MLEHADDRQIFRLALPALGALAADPLVSLVDTLYIGRLGKLSLAALGVNTAIFGMAFFLFNFLAYGTTPLVAGAVARGDRRGAGKTVLQAMLLAALAGVLAAAILLAAAPLLLRAMGASDQLASEGIGYLRIRALAAPAVLLIRAAHGAFRGFSNTRTPFVITLLLNLINLALDPLLIFGLGWGLDGAALATAVAQWCGALLFVWLLLFKQRREFGIELALPPLSELLPLIRVGGSLTLRTLALLSALTLASAVATRVGTLSIAAHQVAAQLWLFMALVIDALAVAGQTLVAERLGRGDRAAARAIAGRLLQLGLGLGVLLGAGFWLLAGPLPTWFSSDTNVVDRVRGIYPFVIFMQPLNALVFVWDGIFMGAEDFRYLALSMLGAAGTCCACLLLVVPLELGLDGVWWAMTLLIVARLVGHALRYFARSGPLSLRVAKTR